MQNDIPSRGEVESRLNAAIKRLLRNDLYLLEVGAEERAICHRLAVYLEPEFASWHVDCEYNRNGEKPKKIVTGEIKPTRAMPDIVVHRRGPNGPNILSVEVKASAKGDADDIEKLKAYITDFKYSFGAFVRFGIRENASKVEKLQFLPEI